MRKALLAIMLCSLCASAQEHSLRPLGVNLENFEYPFPVSYLDLEIQEEACRMAYMDVKAANASKEKVVLLLHGKNFSGAYWEKTAKELSSKGYRVIIPDQIGFGKSTKPVQIQYSFHLLAYNTRRLLDSLGIKKINVVGHSMGGMLAARFTLMYPESCESLVLVNPIGLEDYKLFSPYKPVEWWYENELKSNYESIKNYQLENYYDNKWKQEYSRWVEMLAGWTLSADYPRIAWNAALTYDMIITQPVVYEFGRIQVPTLLIIGQRDRTALGKNLAPEAVRKNMGDYPSLGKKTAAAIKGSRLVELDNVGHLPHIEAYERFITPLIEFLDTR